MNKTSEDRIAAGRRRLAALGWVLPAPRARATVRPTGWGSHYYAAPAFEGAKHCACGCETLIPSNRKWFEHEHGYSYVPKERPPRDCPECGEVYLPATWGSGVPLGYCSKKCSNDASYARHHPKKPRPPCSDEPSYRTARRHRSPEWRDRRAIAAIYAARTEGEHVDHIIPLRGATVSGLHVAGNLRRIPGPTNLVKSNHFEPAWDIRRPDLLRG